MILYDKKIQIKHECLDNFTSKSNKSTGEGDVLEEESLLQSNNPLYKKTTFGKSSVPPIMISLGHYSKKKINSLIKGEWGKKALCCIR